MTDNRRDDEPLPTLDAAAPDRGDTTRRVRTFRSIKNFCKALDAMTPAEQRAWIRWFVERYRVD